LLLLLFSTVAAQEEPARTDYTEQVEVRLIQLEVTVWPSGGAYETCRGLTAADFSLTVNRKPQERFSVDTAGIETTTVTEEVEPAAEPEATPADPLTLALFFDLWHLDRFAFARACGRTRHRAFEQAREMVRTMMRQGDRLLIVTFSGWPCVHHGWIRNPEEALRVLDRVEVSPAVVTARTEHLHEDALLEGLNSLLLALGRYPGRKEVLYLADDFPFEEVKLRIYDMAARAQANRVTVHTVDLIQHCRSIACELGGLRCTAFRQPVALGPMASSTGGRLFNSGVVSQAVAEIREVQGCRYVISFPYETTRSKRKRPRVDVRVKRKGLSLRAPASFQNPDRPPKEREEQDALFLLPQFGQGLIAEVGLWPLRPSGKGKRWNAMMIARLMREPGAEWPEGLTEIVVDAGAHQRSRMYGQFRRVLTGAELEQLRTSERGKLFAFPLADVRPGEATVVVRAKGGETDLEANVRGWFTVPEPPGPGEARPWFIADRLARVGDEVTLLPSMDGTVPEESAALLVGYGCPSGPEIDATGALVARDGERRVPVPIGWFEAPSESSDGAACGWLVGEVSPDLEAGVWSFEPPASLAYPEELPPLELRVGSAR
jgi:VWFA-related protein